MCGHTHPPPIPASSIAPAPANLLLQGAAFPSLSARQLHQHAAEAAAGLCLRPPLYGGAEATLLNLLTFSPLPLKVTEPTGNNPLTLLKSLATRLLVLVQLGRWGARWGCMAVTGRYLRQCHLTLDSWLFSRAQPVDGVMYSRTRRGLTCDAVGQAAQSEEIL